MAYTLMELLVVIAIIAILAGLILTIIPIVVEKRARLRAQTQLRLLTLAINDYKTDLNEYPPDNTLTPTRPPLFYELTGVSFDKARGEYRSSVEGQGAMSAAALPFSNKGFRNCAPDGGLGKDFLHGLRADQYAEDKSGAYTGYRFLSLPVRGTGGDFNPWNYVSTDPTNNPNSYDLWIQIVPGKKAIRIDNFKTP
jgi:prepilin-type N-terminal cleavage/methylation domain-containing protein